MAVLATGQITIVDYNDALSLQGFIGANLAKTQIYNPDNNTYTPNWAVSPYMVLTPSLFILGKSEDIITSPQVQSIKWYDAANPNTELTSGSTYDIPASGLKKLTIKQNVLVGNINAKDYICEVVYRDPTTGLDIATKLSISLSRVSSGGGIVTAIAMTPLGNVFKNGATTSLKANVDLWRGSTIDNTLVSYQWYIQDPQITADQGAGAGWEKLTSTTNYGITGYTTREITVPASAVPSLEVFKVAVKDIDSASPTYNQTFWETVTFIDTSDPIQVSVTSSGGTIFKNGQGSSVLTAKLFRGGEEIDTTSPYKYVYKWYKYDKAGVLVTDFGGTGVAFKTGKTLTIGDADVRVKATFNVDIEG
ncbi:hypothetical protein ACQKJG_18925 [Priestia megaterium]|uniref:hypothetical protein n=1 Tax=Priestia megaterium TaxID=1404 RepID=UPI003D08F278